MTKRSIVPCLWFDDHAEQAAQFYTRTFPDGRLIAVSRYPQSLDNPSGKPRGSVLTVEFEIAGQRFTALNGGPAFVINPSISFFVHVEAVTEATALFSELAAGGEVLMPLDAYPWSERYGWVQDRFGVSWQVIAGRRGQAGAIIVPCLMFAGPVHSRAEEAIRQYTQVFDEGRIGSLERYTADEGPEGTLKHGRFSVAGQEMVAMDSHVSHNISFNEAVSLQVMCEGQAEVDRYWQTLSEGGEHGPCGWLKDRFGVSWQIVPEQIAGWMASPDREAQGRAFAALLTMQKLDIAALQAAFEGR